MAQLTIQSATWRYAGTALRPAFLFMVAFALNSTPHEAAHAISACLLGFRATLFHLWVTPDTAGATPSQLAMIAAAGPIFSLALGATSWTLYQWRYRLKPCGLLLLMLAIVGIYSFLGPLAGSAFGGDFHRALTSLAAPSVIAYAASASGFVLLPLFMFFMGRELVLWSPVHDGRIQAVTFTTVAPWLIGSALALLLYWPMPAFLIGSTITGSGFWLFAVIGAAFRFPAVDADKPVLSLTAWDFAIMAIAVTMVRLLTRGVTLG